MKSTPLTPEQAARELGVSRATVYELVAKGELDAFQIHRAIRIEPKAIEKFKAAHRVQVAKRTEPVPVVRRPIRSSNELGNDRYVN